MIGSFFAIALNGFREARRNRATIVVALFAIGLILSGSLLMDATVATLHRTLIDVGLGSMSVLLVVLTIFLSSGMLSREIEKRTIFLVVSRPISRGLFLTARLAGNMLTLAVLLAAMSACFFLEMVLFNVPITGAQIAATGMLWFELLLLSAVGFLMSSFSTQMVSIFVTASIFFAGHLSSDIYKLASKAAAPSLKVLGQAVYYLLPNLERFNYRPHAAHALAPDWATVAGSAGYGIAYSVALTVVAIALFARRDFK